MTAPELTPAALELQLEQEIAQFALDPLGYVRYVFPWGEAGTELADQPGPRQWQIDVLDEIGTKLRAMFDAGGAIEDAVQEAIRIARSSGHGIGKSALIAMLTKWALDTLPDTKVVITANTEKQLTTKTAPELAKWNRLSITAHWFTWATTSLKSTDPAHEATWRADLVPWSENNTEAFAGLHNLSKRIVLLMDEASAIADKVWEVAEGALTDARTQILWLVFGNPTRPTGRFRECFRKFKHRWSGKQIDSRTVEGINRGQADEWVADHREDSDFVKVRVRGMFPSVAAGQYLSEADVDAAYGRIVPRGSFEFAPKILTLDPAWDGGDELVVGLRQGLVYRTLRTIAKNDNDVQVANMLARIEDEEQADAVFVDFGYGTGIVSVGRTLGRDWILVQFGGASADPACLNKRAEIYKAGKQWLKEGGSIQKDPILQAQLTSIETIPRMDGKVALESKKDMKARGLDSPDRADAWAMSFAFPVAKKDTRRAGALAGSGRGHQSISDYDPLASEPAGVAARAYDPYQPIATPAAASAYDPFADLGR